MAPNITPNDASKLMPIFKKLGLSIPKVLAAQTYLNSDKLTADEKARRLFGIAPEDDMSAFFAERLTKEEIDLLKKAINL